MRNIRQLLVAFLMSAVVACGGGGTLGDSGTPTTPVYSATIKLVDSSGVEAGNVASAKPLTVQVTLSSSNGGSVSDKLISFSLSDAEAASFNNGTASAVTNGSGVATIGLLAGTKSGAATITANLPDNNKVTKNFTSSGDGGPVNSDPVSSVLLQADKIQLGSGVTDKVELTALVRDKTLNLLPNVAVKFGIETGSDGELEVVTAVTDKSGIAKALLTTKSNPQLRDVVVSATAGATAIKSQLTIKVIGTSIDVSAPAAVVLGGSVDLAFTLQDSGGQPLRDKVLSVTSSLGNTFDNTTPRTDAVTGRATVRYTAANAGQDVVTISSMGVSRSLTIVVNSDAFAYVKPAGEAAVPEIALNTAASATVRWTRSNSPMSGQDVDFTTTRGVIATTAAALSDKVVANSQTNTAGESQVFMSSKFAGLASISAATKSGGVALQTQKLVEFIATIPDPLRPLEVQAIPAQLAPGDKALIQAIVRDANNNPVKNADVVFTLVNSFGGQISPATGKTNSQGIATTEFTADFTSPGSGTPNDPSGLRVKATLANNDTITGSTAIAVGNRTLFFRFATGNGIEESADKILYRKKYAVIVTDSSGNPVPNQQLNVAVFPKRYHKGKWFKRPVLASFKNWEAIYSDEPDDLTCLSEDKNRNGILDIGEDVNNDGELTPGNVVVVDKTITSNAEGLANFTLTYPKEYAPFVEVDVVVSGLAAGTENVSSRTITLGYSSADATDESSPPWNSPFGVDAVANEIGFSTKAICGINGQTFPLN